VRSEHVEAAKCSRLFLGMIMLLRIMVVGSNFCLPETKPSSDRKFEEFCESLGESLAKRGHVIIVLSDDELHADSHLIRGYAGMSSTAVHLPAIRVSYGTKTDTDNPSGIKFQNLRSRFTSVTFDDFRTKSEYPFNRFEIVGDADALVFIGGGISSKQLLEIAHALRKPIIPIEAFGGIAEEAWRQQRAYIEEVSGNNSRRPIEQDFGDLYKGRTDDIVRIVEKVVQARKKEASMPLPILLLVEFVALGLWFLLVHAGDAYPEIAMPIIILTTAAFGIVLRSLVRLFSDPDLTLRTKAFFLELGLGIGFGAIYYMLFLIGGNVISKDLSATLKAGSFQSVALVVSILIVAVSFLLEDSIKKARIKLEEAAGF